MRPADNIERLINKLQVEPRNEVSRRNLDDALAAQKKANESTELQPTIWRIIMKNPITKFAIAVVIILILFTSFHFLSNSFESVTYADVIKIIQNSSYTFDSTTVGDVDDSIKAHFAILLSVGCRIDMDDPSQGNASSIIDFNTGNAIVLDHVNKIALTEPPESENLFVNGPFAMFLNPAERLWDTKNGTEMQLGIKEIDGVSAIGFKVEQMKENSNFDITIWANRKTAAPVRVELTLHDPDNSHSVTFIMTNFNLNAELSKELFSTKPPQGYKVTTFQSIREKIDSAFGQQQ